MEDIAIFPNPSNGIFTFVSNSNQQLRNVDVEIFDLYGIRVYESFRLNLSSAHKLNLTFLPKGIYFVKMNDTGNFSTRIIVLQ